MVSPYMSKTSGHATHENNRTFIVTIKELSIPEIEKQLNPCTRGGYVCSDGRSKDFGPAAPETEIIRGPDGYPRARPVQDVKDTITEDELRDLMKIRNSRKCDPEFDTKFAQFMDYIWNGIMRELDLDDCTCERD